MKFTAILIVSLVFLQGCTTFRSGGGPEPAFDAGKDLTALLEEFSDRSTIPKYYASPSKESRNQFITGRLVVTDLKYLLFLRSSTAERQALDSAHDILVLSLGLAGASFNAASTKTILAASSAAVSGTKVTIDKNYYFEKSIPALIASMNAQRAQALIPILEGSTQTLEVYPFEKAVTDLHAYYYAGTYLGAIQAIQADAGAKQAIANERIQSISSMPSDAVELKKSMTLAIGSLTTGDLDKATAILTAYGQTVSDKDDLDQVKKALQALVRSARTKAQVDTLATHFRSQSFIP